MYCYTQYTAVHVILDILVHLHSLVENTCRSKDIGVLCTQDLNSVAINLRANAMSHMVHTSSRCVQDMNSR